MILSAVPDSVSTQIAPAGNRDFIHIYNDSAATAYICYDSDDGSAKAGGSNALTASNGIPIAPGGFFQLNNDGHRNLYNKPIYAFIVGGGNLRLQGMS